MSGGAADARGPHWPFAGIFQQTAGAFTGIKGIGDWSTWGSRTVLESLVAAVRSGLIGRSVDTEVGGKRLVFTLTALDARLDPLGTSAGQADDVSMSAAEVEYAGVNYTTVTAHLSNVHTRVGTRPSLVCAPVDMSLSLTWREAEAALDKHLARIVATCVGPGVVRVSLRRHPRWGWLDVQPSVSGDCVILQAVAVGRGRRAWRFRRLTPRRTMRAGLPNSMNLVGVDIDPRELTVKVRLDQWRFDYGDVLGLGIQGRHENSAEEKP